MSSFTVFQYSLCKLLWILLDQGFSMRPRIVGKQRRSTASQSDQQKVAPKAPLAGILYLMALRAVEEREMQEMPCDDYYYDTASLVANYSHRDARRSSDVSTIRESISFHTMIEENISGSVGCDETSLSCHGALCVGSP